MEPKTLVLFVVGIALLVVGADQLVRGASRLARSFGVSPLVVGLTVVAYGTSAPEVAVSVTSAVQGQASLAVGNVIGSNIFNTLFILGLSALIAPLVVAQQLVRFDVPLMIALSFGVYGLGYDGNVSRFEGLLLVALAVGYTVFVIASSRREGDAVKDEYAQEYGKGEGRSKPLRQIIRVVAGLGLLVTGSRWLVDGAVAIATALGLSDLIVGLTIVAAGTSLPEVATSVLASVRGERDIAVGNVVGSCIFNIVVVLGVSGLAAPNGVEVNPSALSFDVPVMIAVAVACLPILFTGRLIARWEGALFLAYYAAYTTYLILDATNHDALPLFSRTMIAFVLPITALTLGFLAVRAVWKRKPRTE